MNTAISALLIFLMATPGMAAERANVEVITLGENTKMTVDPSERILVRKFYREVFGCKVVEKDNLDLVAVAKNFYIGIIYEKPALTKSDHLKATWLELRVDDPEKLKQKILDFGVKEIKYWDKEHFYFQAPGGQVFRLIGKTEDMSKWQK